MIDSAELMDSCTVCGGPIISASSVGVCGKADCRKKFYKKAYDAVHTVKANDSDNQTPPTDDEVKQMKRMYSGFKTIEYIAEKMGYTEKTIRKYVYVS